MPWWSQDHYEFCIPWIPFECNDCGSVMGFELRRDCCTRGLVVANAVIHARKGQVPLHGTSPRRPRSHRVTRDSQTRGWYNQKCEWRLIQNDDGAQVQDIKHLQGCVLENIICRWIQINVAVIPQGAFLHLAHVVFSSCASPASPSHIKLGV